VDPVDPATVRALAERLVGISTVGPDPEGAKQCAAALRASLPQGAEAGDWPSESGEPIVWAELRGESKRTVILLGHYDTVGTSEFVALAAPEGERIACSPAALLARLQDRAAAELPPEVAEDLAEERAAPGTWMFGRGALDMKSGLAAGVGAMNALASTPGPEGNVLFVACPDEEGQSTGMRRAVERLAEWAERDRLELVGALNLDYAEEPAVHHGSVGKLLVSLWVRGAPAHAANPFAGADAAQLAAVIATRLTVAKTLIEREGDVAGAPPVVLRLRDLKQRYDVQTAVESEIELNLITSRRPLGQTLEMLRAEIVAALLESGQAMAELAEWSGRPPRTSQAAVVLTVAELADRAGERASTGGSLDEDPRQAMRERVRALSAAAGITGPLVVIGLLPPYYPHAAPRTGGLADRMRPWLAREEIPLRDRYPYISDAAYLAWRADPETEIAALMPAWGRGYELPVAAASKLDLEVVTLGPWGRDAHGLYERVHAPYAFGRLPGLVAAAAREALRA
jgi:arginine utilization protein RocB